MNLRLKVLHYCCWLSRLLAQAFVDNLVCMQKKTSSDQNTTSRRSASKPREKQPGDPLSGSSQEAIQAELQLQATLAKKLKLKQVRVDFPPLRPVSNIM